MRFADSATAEEAPTLPMDNPAFSLAMKNERLLGELQSLFEAQASDRSEPAPDADMHHFEGAEGELYALVEAIKRLGLRATLVAHPRSDLRVDGLIEL